MSLQNRLPHEIDQRESGETTPMSVVAKNRSIRYIEDSTRGRLKICFGRGFYTSLRLLYVMMMASQRSASLCGISDKDLFTHSYKNKAVVLRDSEQHKTLKVRGKHFKT